MRRWDGCDDVPRDRLDVHPPPISETRLGAETRQTERDGEREKVKKRKRADWPGWENCPKTPRSRVGIGLGV